MVKAMAMEVVRVTLTAVTMERLMAAAMVKWRVEVTASWRAVVLVGMGWVSLVAPATVTWVEMERRILSSRTTDPGPGISCGTFRLCRGYKGGYDLGVLKWSRNGFHTAHTDQYSSARQD